MLCCNTSSVLESLERECCRRHLQQRLHADLLNCKKTTFFMTQLSGWQGYCRDWTMCFRVGCFWLLMNREPHVLLSHCPIIPVSSWPWILLSASSQRLLIHSTTWSPWAGEWSRTGRQPGGFTTVLTCHYSVLLLPLSLSAKSSANRGLCFSLCSILLFPPLGK